MSIATGIIAAGAAFKEETGKRLEEIHLDPALYDTLVIEFAKLIQSAKMRPAYVNTIDWIEVDGIKVRKYHAERSPR